MIVVQAIGAEGVVAAQCRSLVKAYLPQLVKIIATMPSDQVGVPLYGQVTQLYDCTAPHFAVCLIPATLYVASADVLC